MPSQRTLSYREVLTPALHRRFTSSALLVLIICYVESILIAEKTSWFWFWFPIGSAGIRTLLLFISSLVVFISSVASLHFGLRTNICQATAVIQNILSLGSIQTFAWYFFSAWWFGEVYIWSASESAGLEWRTAAQSWERPRLNERPIYLRCVFLIFAMVQSGLHFARGQDRIGLAHNTSKDARIPKQPSTTSDSIYARLTVLLPLISWDPKSLFTTICDNIAIRTLGISLLAPFVYSLFLRQTAWSWSLSFARVMFNVPITQLSYIPPHYPSLIYRSLVAGFLLNLLWQASNLLFISYVGGQPPLKNGQPLSSQSREPIRTLLHGLKSKKEIANTFAFWELSLITSSFPVSRKAIFADIESPAGSAWTQISSLCLNNISAIDARINLFLRPPSEESANLPKPIVESLPKISQPLRHDNVLAGSPKPANSLEMIESNIGALARSFGQSPNPPNPSRVFGAEAKKVIQHGSQKLITNSPARQLLKTGSRNDKTASTTNAESLISPSTIIWSLSLRLLQNPYLGPPFRQTFARRLSHITLSASGVPSHSSPSSLPSSTLSPYSTFYPIIFSTRALADLAIASLSEDPYGRVAKDVPRIICTFTGTIKTLEAFKRNLPPHWTDVDFPSSQVEQGKGRNGAPEVELVIQELKDGLRDLIKAFSGYVKELDLTDSEWEIAKSVAGREHDCTGDNKSSVNN